ncbi:MAG TPA: hypothetical protein VFH74_03620 [Gaiellales bacterium]|nr:hypothetical protein [Gaiellales bacterium]
MNELSRWAERARAYARSELKDADQAREQARRDRTAGRLQRAVACEHEARILEQAARTQLLIADEIQAPVPERGGSQ